SLLSVPLALIYDLTLLTVAIAWLVRAGRGTGFLRWEKLAMSFCFLVPLVSRHLGQATHIPLAPLAPAVLLALCLVRTLRARMRFEPLGGVARIRGAVTGKGPGNPAISALPTEPGPKPA